MLVGLFALLAALIASGEGVDETGRSSPPKVPGCLRAQRNGLPRALRCHADHLSLQWTSSAVIASRGGCFVGWQSLHLETLRSAFGDGRITSGTHSEIFRRGISQRRGRPPGNSDECAEASVCFHIPDRKRGGGQGGDALGCRTYHS